MLRKIVSRLLLALLVAMPLVLGGDVLRLSPTREAATPYLYSIAQWELANFLSKWVHKAATMLPWAGASSETRRGAVEEYFRLSLEYRGLLAERDRVAATPGEESRRRVAVLETQAATVKERRDSLRNDVEETLESEISAVAAEEGLALRGALLWPPVDIRLTDTPTALITSPRDRIARLDTLLLEPDMAVADMERLEDRLLQTEDISALVVDIGGVAAYPAPVASGNSLDWTLDTSAHEWLHHYLAFRPLGWHMFSDADMQTLNETVADMAGRELGRRALARLGLGGDAVASGADASGTASPPPSFDFGREMRETRLRVDEMLAEGRAAEAEAYMEQRRQSFVANGYYIRKLNQAYFAFHGTYGESPASVSPIAGQLRELRDLVPDVGTFIRTVEGVSTYAGFLEVLARLRADAAS